MCSVRNAQSSSITRIPFLQDKKRIARKKAEVKQAELLARGIDVRDQTNILDEEDNDLLF